MPATLNRLVAVTLSVQRLLFGLYDMFAFTWV
jgi:hypothetical protein